MKFILVIIIALMVIFNFWCFYKSRKYLNRVNGENEESNKNYEKGLKYIKISVLVSVIICLTGATCIILIKVI